MKRAHGKEERGSGGTIGVLLKSGGRLRWLTLIVFWLVQGAALYVLQSASYSMAEHVEGSDGVWVGLAGLENFWRLMGNPEYQAWAGVGIAMLTLGQVLFLLPVRKPGPISTGKGKSLRLSLLMAGLSIGALSVAMVATLVSVFDTGWNKSGGMWLRTGLVCVTGWAVATPLLIAFCKPGRRETVLGRVASWIFLGTVAEIALMIPMDVMVRRRASCYCWEGSYWGLTVGGFVGVWALGPAVFLPLVARRRKRWHGGLCEVCGYDMTSTPDAERCPECGAGWKRERTETGQGEIAARSDSGSEKAV